MSSQTPMAIGLLDLTVESSPLGRLSPATLDEHEADTFREHGFVNVLSPWSSSVSP
jgi:hypothetical protein